MVQFSTLIVLSSSKSDLVGILDTYFYSLLCYNLNNIIRWNFKKYVCCEILLYATKFKIYVN